MTELKLNENLVKITGDCAIDKALEMGQTYSIGAMIDITDDRRKNNQDGTFDRIFTGKLLKGLITDNHGPSIRAKEKTKQSVKLRLAILRCKTDFKPEMEDEAWYKLIMGGLQHHLPIFIEQILKDN